MKELWERQKWDTQASFKAFHKFYLSQDAPRTVNRGYQDHQKSIGKKQVKKNAPGRWRNWSNGLTLKGKKIRGAYTWLDRANAYDDYQAWLDRDVWEKRRAELREKEYALGDDLHNLAASILAEGDNFLKSTKKFVAGTDGELDQIIITVALDANLAVKAAGMSSKIKRLAAGMETDYQKIESKEPTSIESIKALQKADKSLDDESS